jgi:hypothetical protein
MTTEETPKDFSTTKILTYKLLKKINERSVIDKRNQNVYFDKLPIKDDNTVYPVGMSFVHNDKEIRTRITLNGEGDTILLDMSFDEFRHLPTYGDYQEALNDEAAKRGQQ